MTTRVGTTRNPQTNYKTSEHCVAYLDILGGKNKIYNDNNHEFLNLLNMIYEDAIEETHFIFRKKDISTRIFSDNILFAIKIEENDNHAEEKISDLLNLTANTILEALCYGILLRGAITLGDFFHNEIFVYGKALVESVEMEEKYAIYPRVITTDEVQQIVPQCFYKDPDGLNVFKYLYYVTNPGTISTIQLNLLNMLKNRPDKKAEQKIRWAISYFNYYYTHLSRSIDKPQITDEDIEKALKT